MDTIEVSKLLEDFTDVNCDQTEFEYFSTTTDDEKLLNDLIQKINA